MRIMQLLLITMMVLMSACSSMKTVDVSPEEVRRQIISENILPSGETVRIVTSDGQVHKFRVTEVNSDERLILGKEESVAIDEIVAVETKEFSLGKTALLAGGVASAWLILAAVATASLLGAGF